MHLAVFRPVNVDGLRRPYDMWCGCALFVFGEVVCVWPVPPLVVLTRGEVLLFAVCSSVEASTFLRGGDIRGAVCYDCSSSSTMFHVVVVDDVVVVIVSFSIVSIFAVGLVFGYVVQVIVACFSTVITWLRRGSLFRSSTIF